MIFSYLNNAYLKLNLNSSTKPAEKFEYREHLIIELSIRKKITHHTIMNLNYCIFDVITYVHKKRVEIKKPLVTIAKVSFHFTLEKQTPINVMIDNLQKLLAPLKKQLNLDWIELLPSANAGEFSAMHLAQKLAHEMSESNISKKKMKRIAHMCLSEKNMGHMIKISGRINGYGITRKDVVISGKIARNTLKYNLEAARHVYLGKAGCIGVQVWLNKGLLPSIEKTVETLHQQQNTQALKESKIKSDRWKLESEKLSKSSVKTGF